MKRVGDVMSVAVGTIVTAEEGDSLQDTATVLARADVGAVVVLDSHGAAGILTERDLVRAVAEGADLERAQVGDHMTLSPVTIDRGATLDEAVASMSDNRVRHLVVTSEGEIAGILSARDLVDALAGTEQAGA